MHRLPNTGVLTQILAGRAILEYLDAFKSVNGWKVLVVDEHSRGLIYAVLKPGEILEENIIG